MIWRLCLKSLNADVVELVDTLDLGSSAERCESSSLSVRTKYGFVALLSYKFAE